MNEEMGEWVNGASVSEDKEAKGPKAVKTGQVGTPDNSQGNITKLKFAWYHK